MLDWATDRYWSNVQEAANADAEFRRHARFWNATIRLGLGNRKLKLRIENGAVVGIAPWFGAIATDLSIGAAEDDWQALLAAEPRPFYQDLYAAAIHHGFDIVGDTDDYCAYYPALRRLIDLMRAVRNQAAAPPLGDPLCRRGGSNPHVRRCGRSLRAPDDRRRSPSRLLRASGHRRCRLVAAAHRRRGRSPVASRSRRCAAAIEVPPDRLRPALPRQVGAA